MRLGFVVWWVVLSLLPVSRASAQHISGRSDAFPATVAVTPIHLPECSGHSRAGSALLQLIVGTGTGVIAVEIAAGAVAATAAGRYMNGKGTDVDRSLDLVGYPAYVLGSAAGVYWIGHLRDHEGRFLPTLLGSVLGLGAPGATLAYHLSDRSRGHSPSRCAAPEAEPPHQFARLHGPRAETVLFQLRF